jgi:transposase, IS30 family
MARMTYSRLSITEQEIIHKRLAEGRSQKSIAEELARHESTISREIHREGMTRSTYRPSLAVEHAKKQAFKRRRKNKLVLDKELADFVEEKLKQRWSPEQISGVLKKRLPDHPQRDISHEAIYQYIYSIEDKEKRKELIGYLRQSRRRRKPHKDKKTKRITIKGLVSIHDRPKEVESREEPGHWEGDLVVGKDHQSAIGTLVERTTRLTIIVSFQGYPNATQTAIGFAAALGIFPAHMKRSLTYDRGTEMAGHARFTEITGISVFFADPYSPWQRGTNENSNGLIRDYLPKKTDFRDIDDLKLLKVQMDLNSRPRKLLDFRSPEEIFSWLMSHPGKIIDDFFASNYPLAL